MLQKEIWEKIGRGESLAPNEQLEFVQFGEKLQLAESLLSSWVVPGTGNFDFPKGFSVIKSEVLTADAASVVFDVNDIGAKHLMIMGSGKVDGVGAMNMYLRFNDDTGNNYAFQDVEAGSGTVNGFGSSSGYPYLPVGVFTNTAYTPPGSFVAFLPHFRNESFYKQAVSLAAMHSLLVISSGTWYNTSPVNKISIGTTAANIKANSLISIYGIY